MPSFPFDLHGFPRVIRLARLRRDSQQLVYDFPESDRCSAERIPAFFLPYLSLEVKGQGHQEEEELSAIYEIYVTTCDNKKDINQFIRWETVAL